MSLTQPKRDTLRAWIQEVAAGDADLYASRMMAALGREASSRLLDTSPGGTPALPAAWVPLMREPIPSIGLVLHIDTYRVPRVSEATCSIAVVALPGRRRHEYEYKEVARWGGFGVTLDERASSRLEPRAAGALACWLREHGVAR